MFLIFLLQSTGPVTSSGSPSACTKEKNNELLFRFDGDEVRAIFTPRYTPVDNFEILERLDSLGYSSDTEVQCSVDQELMMLNIPAGNTFTINGDTMKTGLSISNSEIGIASLSISAFILRLICTNGMISATGVALDTGVTCQTSTNLRLASSFNSSLLSTMEDSSERFLL